MGVNRNFSHQQRSTFGHLFVIPFNVQTVILIIISRNIYIFKINLNVQTNQIKQKFYCIKHIYMPIMDNKRVSCALH